jgi:prolyl 4-hydroxylase
LHDFLNSDECEALVAMIDSQRKPSRLMSSGHPDTGFRTSETCNLDPNDGLVRLVETRISALLGIDPQCGEFLQGQRYGAGQEFKPHHDFLRESEPYWARQKEIGGQRTWTAMTYLNVPEKGGETFFPRLRLKLIPRRGNLVAWNNLDGHGEPNAFSLHQGMPVVTGVKFIITKWYRERPWALGARTSSRQRRA